MHFHFVSHPCNGMVYLGWLWKVSPVIGTSRLPRRGLEAAGGVLRVARILLNYFVTKLQTSTPAVLINFAMGNRVIIIDPKASFRDFFLLKTCGLDH